MREKNLLSLSYGRLRRKDIDSAAGLVPASYETYQIVEPGDTVVRPTDLQNDQRSLRTAFTTERGIITSAYLALSPRAGCDPKFISYLLHSIDVSKRLYGLGAGMRQTLSYSDLRDLPVVVPPRDVQRQIADSLDRETAQIDAFIADQQYLIRLLIERREAELEALLHSQGDVSRRKLRRVIASIADGPFGSALTSAHYTDSGARVVRLGNIGVGKFRDDDHAYISNEYFETLRAHEVLSGDVLVAGLGDDRMPLGRACVAPNLGPAIVKADCYRVRPIEVLPDYLALVLNSDDARRQVALLARGSTRQRLNTSVILDVELPLVDLQSQAATVAAARRTMEVADEAVADATRAIELSRERRAALISAAVTGKIDVTA